MEVESVENDKVLISTMKHFFDSYGLPEYLFSEKYNRVVVRAMESDRPVGIGYGVALRESRDFFAHYFYLIDEFRSWQNLFGIFQTMFETAKEKYGIIVFHWIYQMKNGQDKIRAHFSTDKNYCIDDYEKYIRSGLRIRDLAYLEKKTWYNQKLLDQKGFYVKSWEECTALETEKIRKREAEKDPEYLSPFVDDPDNRLDLHSSGLLIRKGTEDICGWMICEKLSEKRILIRRLYIYKEIRTFNITPAFCAYILGNVTDRYEEMYFDVSDKNRSMKHVVRRYIEPVVQFQCYVCKIHIVCAEKHPAL